jgi:outer membrane receptor for ferrienterochelin and colicins
MKSIVIQMFSAIVIFFFTSHYLSAQASEVSGFVKSDGNAVPFASVFIKELSLACLTDTTGYFEIAHIPNGTYVISISCLGYLSIDKTININSDEVIRLNIELFELENELSEVVISGTLKEIMRMESPVPVELYSPKFFLKNPSPNIYESLQNVNGVRPQINCQVCNTGDIHINGLEGPYTMVLIDGMPIVSSLSTVYGLSGIPNSLIERVEVVKGPASSLYGSEAVGGLINVITKNPSAAPRISADFMATTWAEFNADLGFKLKVSDRAEMLTGISYFNFQDRIDKNNDFFTDVPLQDRITVFQKWSFKRKDKKLLNVIGRYMFEDRWGGDVLWNEEFRGGDSIYGESIYTNRWEIIANYQLPVKEKVLLNFSFNDHYQNSAYGTTSFIAKQSIAFSQITWDRTISHHSILAGAAMRYTFYDDNTPATFNASGANPINQPQNMYLPGFFVQDEFNIAPEHKFLLGARYDYNSYHGAIFTPRMAYKWSLNATNVLRLNAGTGFRVVNLFTEDHAALTGARAIEILDQLRPEKSYNVNLNFVRKVYCKNSNSIAIDASCFYTYFNNRIIGDYESNPNKIIYNNLSGYAENSGFVLNLEFSLKNNLGVITGLTFMDNSITIQGVSSQQILTEKFTGTWALSYNLFKQKCSVDYTGNLYSPMRLPKLGSLDPRADYSSWWSIQNIQFTYKGMNNWEFYGGVKNLLNWTPGRNNPFIISRSYDPFDKDVVFDESGNVIANASNPYGLTFDTTYVYAPNQGIRGFIGVRYMLK